MKYIGFILLVVFFAGCGPKNIVINYAPSSTMVVNGETSIGEFEYLASKKFKVKPNQIRNTALGSIYFEKNINEYLKDAVFNESRLVGINISSDENLLTGQINDFLIDDLGYSVDWVLDITYNLEKNGVLCYSKSKVTNKNTSKFINIFGSLNEVIKLNIEELYKDNNFRKCIK